MIIEKSCFETCQNVIQRYEQEGLKKQLGVFRTQVDAPSRSRKKDRITHVDLQFVEVDDAGRFMRDLGIRSVPVDELPLAVHLWQSPMPRRLRDPLPPEQEQGKPWRSEEHTSELQSLMRISYAVFCLKKKNNIYIQKRDKHK